MNNQNSQKGNLYLIIAIIVGVVAIGAVGFASWKYFGGGSELEKEKSQPSYLPKQEKTVPQIEEQEEKIPSKKTDEMADLGTYQSPDGTLSAQIIPVGETQESKIQIYTNKNVLLQKADYSSEDGDHGLIVVRVEWTPDSQFFIYSAISSGGHQPWFSRVYFYDRFNNKIYSFKDMSGFTVANNEFTITSPDIVKFTVYTSTGMGPKITKSFKLSDVIKTDETADWKVYQNEEYGYEIKYSPSFKIDVSDQMKKITIGSPAVPYYTVSIEENISFLKELKSLMQEQVEYLAPPNLKITWKDTIIADKKAIEMSYESFAGGTATIRKTGVIWGTTAYIISSSSYKNNEAEYYQILSTFKFTE